MEQSSSQQLVSPVVVGYSSVPRRGELLASRSHDAKTIILVHRKQGPGPCNCSSGLPNDPSRTLPGPSRPLR